MGLLSRAMRLLGEQDCWLCGSATPDSLCRQCVADLPASGAANCPLCALPTPAGATCGTCLSAAPAYDASLAALVYAWPADRMVAALKYHAALGLAAPLAGFLGDVVERHGLASRPDLMIVPPLSRERLAERGFNQSLELARHLGQRFGVPVAATALARVRDTTPQARLKPDERARNVKGAFAATRRFDGLAVAVVDDVMTTGATLAEIAAVVKAAGAVRVVNWVVARALPHPME
ncbi:MAG: ComF family protein [Burkholderiales bacterium]|nr:ComF family protein [Burkholderiales bacterium]